jgi:chromosome segregation ATPase
MATEPENLTLKQLSLLHTEVQEGFALINNKIGALAEGMITMRRRLNDIDHRLDHMGQNIAGLRTDMQTVSLAVDQHTTRLDQMEKPHDPTHA